MGSFICLAFSHEELLQAFLMPVAERINDTILHSHQLLIQRFDNQTYDFQLPALLLHQKLPSPHHDMYLLPHWETPCLTLTHPPTASGPGEELWHHVEHWGCSRGSREWGQLKLLWAVTPCRTPGLITKPMLTSEAEALGEESPAVASLSWLSNGNSND